jgi:hypothetical protein
MHENFLVIGEDPTTLIKYGKVMKMLKNQNI